MLKVLFEMCLENLLEGLKNECQFMTVYLQQLEAVAEISVCAAARRPVDSLA